MPRSSTIAIKTPEGIAFALVLAGPVARFLGAVIDLACISVIMIALNMGLGIMAILSADIARAVAICSYFIISIGYGIAMEWYARGQTVGKRLLGLRVMDVQGLRLHFSQVVIRNLLRVVDMLPVFYLAGGLACLVSQRAQRLGDIAANTIVVRVPKREAPDLEQLLAHKYNSLRDYPHLAARLRQRSDPRAAQIALNALFRRDEFASQERVELFAQIACYFKERVAFPEEASQGITDEQYVRNVVDILFRTK